MRWLPIDCATEFFPARSKLLSLVLPLFWVRDHHGDTAWLAVLFRRWRVFLVLGRTEV